MRYSQEMYGDKSEGDLQKTESILGWIDSPITWRRNRIKSANQFANRKRCRFCEYCSQFAARRNESIHHLEKWFNFNPQFRNTNQFRFAILKKASILNHDSEKWFDFNSQSRKVNRISRFTNWFQFTIYKKKKKTRPNSSGLDSQIAPTPDSSEGHSANSIVRWSPPFGTRPIHCFSIWDRLQPRAPITRHLRRVRNFFLWNAYKNWG